MDHVEAVLKLIIFYYLILESQFRKKLQAGHQSQCLPVRPSLFGGGRASLGRRGICAGLIFARGNETLSYKKLSQAICNCAKGYGPTFGFAVLPNSLTHLLFPQTQKTQTLQRQIIISVLDCEGFLKGLMITEADTRFWAQGGFAFGLEAETVEKLIVWHFTVGLDPCACPTSSQSFVSKPCPWLAYSRLSLLSRLPFDYHLIELNILIKANNKGPNSPSQQAKLPGPVPFEPSLSNVFESSGGEKLFVRNFAIREDIVLFVAAGDRDGFGCRFWVVAGRRTFVYF